MGSDDERERRSEAQVPIITHSTRRREALMGTPRDWALGGAASVLQEGQGFQGTNVGKRGLATAAITEARDQRRRRLVLSPDPQQMPSRTTRK